MIYKLKQIKYAGYKTYKKLYETCIVPIMNYNSGVWGFCNDKYGNALQMCVLRYNTVVCTVKPQFRQSLVNLGGLLIKLQHHLNICKFWNRFNKLEDVRLAKIVVNNDLKNTDHKDTCVNEIKKVKLLNNQEQNWKAALLCKPKLRTYRKIKTNFETFCWII